MDRDDAFRSQPWHALDPALVESGFGGELIVARTRLALALVVLLIPVVGVTRPDADVIDSIALGGTLLLAVVATVVWMVVRTGWTRPWVPFATSAFDVTLISALAIGYVLADRGDAALNSRVTYPAYFIAIAATCLRYDMRVCVATGVVAIVQYCAIILLGASRFPDVSPDLVAYYGRLDWAEQFGRVVLLVTATALATIIVERGRRLRLLSTHDALTGVYNRAYFDERVAEELLRARRYKRPFAIAILDLDRFKAVNDKFGHAAGDEALQQFAALLRDSFRRTDIVARYGGDEFAIALPETDTEESERKLEALRRRVAETEVVVGDPPRGITLTFSAGVVHYPGDGDVSDDLVHMSDRNLLEAKRIGRNRVVGSAVADDD